MALLIKNGRIITATDDYVAEFTKDVPRVRVITAGENDRFFCQVP